MFLYDGCILKNNNNDYVQNIMFIFILINDHIHTNTDKFIHVIIAFVQMAITYMH